MEKSGSSYVRVKLEHENFVTIRVGGVLRDTEVKQGAQAMTNLVQKLRADGRPICYLFDFTNMRGLDISARRGSVEVYKKLDYDYEAVFGASHMVRVMFSLLGKISKGLAGMRQFNTEEQAVAYLQSCVEKGK
jgi:hypothetical protein